MPYSHTDSFKQEARESFFKLDMDAKVDDYNILIGALVNELSELFTDKDLSPNCYMDVLRTKLLEAIEGSVDIANKVKAGELELDWETEPIARAIKDIEK